MLGRKKSQCDFDWKFCIQIILGSMRHHSQNCITFLCSFRVFERIVFVAIGEVDTPPSPLSMSLLPVPSHPSHKYSNWNMAMFLSLCLPTCQDGICKRHIAGYRLTSHLNVYMHLFYIYLISSIQFSSNLAAFPACCLNTHPS